MDSERELASGFADSLMVNMRQIEPVIGQKQTAKLLALTVKLKALGPIGDEMVDTISPPDGDQNPQAMAAKLQQAGQLAGGRDVVVIDPQNVFGPIP